jgi:hypothetical protein
VQGSSVSTLGGALAVEKQYAWQADHVIMVTMGDKDVIDIGGGDTESLHANTSIEADINEDVSIDEETSALFAITWICTADTDECDFQGHSNSFSCFVTPISRSA